MFFVNGVINFSVNIINLHLGPMNYTNSYQFQFNLNTIDFSHNEQSQFDLLSLKFVIRLINCWINRKLYFYFLADMKFLNYASCVFCRVWCVAVLFLVPFLNAAITKFIMVNKPIKIIEANIITTP